ncbi:MAG: bifunctional glutamate N-acetyltransferase/amino-acid acetyltransferase ArgJ [Clostridia bacterium]|nr:bifunctional glutamate N-acetyltransferase/amino-acid acetyltransferase ArgJ [Clostridia bacterium]
MDNINELDKAYITMPEGFKANGISADLKGNNALDVALIVSDVPCSVAGTYTSNLVKGHSLVRSIDVINKGNKIRGIIVNSKNANACVGQKGYDDACTIASSVSELLGCSGDEILTASTGVIGTRLPVDKIKAVLPQLVNSLSTEEQAAHNAELAMMTTDTVPKEVSAKVTLHDGRQITISGMAKGSGMIHPNLATMIGVFTTDADIDSQVLDKLIHSAVAHTFNRVSVDGDTSVCDMVIIMANGKSGIKIEENSEDYSIFDEAFTSLSNDIAQMIASDGEGATKFIEIEVFGAKDANDAKLIVTSVARSPLCKTAFFGMDANCGRIITAVGYSGATFDPDKVDLELSGLPVYKDGCAIDFDEDVAHELLTKHDINVKITLHEGDAYDRMYTCDFSYDYVKINGSYRS